MTSWSNCKLCWMTVASDTTTSSLSKPLVAQDVSAIVAGHRGRVVMDLVFQKPLKGVFINLYGGINPIHEGAKGVVRYVKEHSISLPIVAKALGNRQEDVVSSLAPLTHHSSEA